jgi:hypothetical protein
MNAVLAFLNGVGHHRHGISGGLDADSVSLMSTLRASYPARASYPPSNRAAGNPRKSNAWSSRRAAERRAAEHSHRGTTGAA